MNMMQIIFIRHGETAGNLERRYVGRTDEPLSEKGRNNLRKLADSGIYPEALDGSELFVSPMLRCRETASIIYPDLEQHLCSDLRECDFGEFEYRNFMELKGNRDYQAWIDSGGTAQFPGGEDPAAFRSRSVRAFQQILAENPECRQLIFVVHGGTIMSVMSVFGEPEAGYFEWQPENGRGYVCRLNEAGRLKVERKI